MAILKNTKINGNLIVDGSLVSTGTMTIESITSDSITANNVVINASTFTINGESPLTESTFKINNFITSNYNSTTGKSFIMLKNINDAKDIVNVYAPVANNSTFGLVKVSYDNHILKISTK